MSDVLWIKGQPTTKLQDVSGSTGLFTDGDWIESKDQDQSGGVRLVQLADIGEGKFLDKSHRFLTDAAARRLRCTFLQEGDILIARMPDPIGRACRLPRMTMPCVTAVDVTVLRPEITWNADFIVAAINTPTFRRAVQAATGGTTRARISRGNLGKLRIPRLDRGIQNKIATVSLSLDRVGSELEVLRKVKTKFRDGLMQELLTGRKRFPEFKTKTWRVAPLGALVKYTPRKVLKPDGRFLSAGVRSHGKGVFLKEDFAPDGIALDELYQLRDRDLVVNITFGWEGAVAIVPPEANGALVSHRFPTYVADEGQVLVDYLRHVIRMKRFVFDVGIASPGGAGRNRVLNRAEFLEIPIRLPDVREQRRIADLLSMLDREIEQLTRLRELFETYKRGLLSRLLSGEIQVPA